MNYCINLTSVNLRTAFQLCPGVNKQPAESSSKEFMNSFRKVLNTEAKYKPSTFKCNHDNLS